MNPVQVMDSSTFLDKIVASAPGRILLAALQTALGSSLFLLVFPFQQAGDITLLKYSVVIGVGFWAGFSARLFLKGHTRALQLAAALVNTALGLSVLFILSGGFLGIPSFYSSLENPDWGSLIQLGLSAPAAWLMVQAFQPGPNVEVKTTPELSPRIETPLPEPLIKDKSPRLKAPAAPKTNTRKAAASSTEKTKPGKGTSPLAVQKKTKKASPIQKATPSPKPAPSAVPTVKTKKPAGVKKTRSKSKALKEIKFIGEEEHVCPYCLDPVLENDPRGVKICPICKTYHHADCWGITGACQIPHSHG